MICTRCGFITVGAPRCSNCGMNFPIATPTPPVTVPPAAVTAHAVTPPTGTIVLTPTPSKWSRFWGFIARKFQRTPTPTPTPPTPAPVGVAGGTPPPQPTKWKKFWGWLIGSARIAIALICTVLWLYGVIKQDALFSTFPFVGILYFVPLEIKFASRARIGVTVLWIILWGAIFAALRTRG